MHLSCSFTLFSIRFIALGLFQELKMFFQNLLYLALLVSVQLFLVMQLSMDILYFLKRCPLTDFSPFIPVRYVALNVVMQYL